MPTTLPPPARRRRALRTDEVPRDAVCLVVIDERAPRLAPFASLPQLLRAGDLVVVNDAATLPASLRARTATGAELELRIVGPIEASALSTVVLGAGDHRTRTEDRPPPPPLAPGEVVTVETVRGGAGAPEVVFEATVRSAAGRLVRLAVRLDEERLWRAIYAAGSPVQYAHRHATLPLWSVQTVYAARPWASEMPSAGRPLTWEVLLALRRAGVEIASLTHAAGLSSIGDAELDRVLLPMPERYELPQRTIDAITATRRRGGRVIAIGTTVVRALEAAAQDGELRAGSGIASLRLGPGTRPQVVDGLVSGLHVPGESHYELLQAFASRSRLDRALGLAAEVGLSGHELGDACLILRDRAG